MSGLVTTADLVTATVLSIKTQEVENKLPDVSSLVKKRDRNCKI